MEGYVMCRPEVRDGPERKSWNPFRNEAKKGWKQGYVVLHNGTLHFYARKGDTEAKRSYPLLPGCSVLGPVRSEMFYTFRIAFPMEYTKSANSNASGSESGSASGSSSQLLDENTALPRQPVRTISGQTVIVDTVTEEDEEDEEDDEYDPENVENESGYAARNNLASPKLTKHATSFKDRTIKATTPPPSQSGSSSLLNWPTATSTASTQLRKRRQHNRAKSLDNNFNPHAESSSIDGLDIQLKKNRKERRIEKKELKIEKKIEKKELKIEKKIAKRVISPEKKFSGSRYRARQAEFGLQTVKQCQMWIDAVNLAIGKTPSGNVPTFNLPPVEVSTEDVTIVDTAPNLGTVPDEIELDLSLKRHSVFDAFMRTGSVNTNIADPSRSAADGDGMRMSYAVHRVHGNMVVHREISPDDSASVMDIKEQAIYYNRTLLFTALAGLISGLLMSYFTLLVPIQLLFGTGMALLTLYLRVEAKEEPGTPTLMTSQVVQGTPESIFSTIMNEELRHFWDVGSSRVTVVERRDDHCDIVHIVLRPVWISALCMYSTSRDLLLLRYWRKEADGSYYIICQSTEHPDVPHGTDFLRATIPSSAWTIQPRCEANVCSTPQTSCVSYMINYEPGGFAGWLNKLGGFDDAFCYPLLCNVASLADCLKARDYGSGSKTELPLNRRHSMGNILDPGDQVEQIQPRNRVSTIDTSKIQVNHVGLVKGIKQRTVTTNRTFFAEPDARKFDVRGANYLNDRVKVKAAPAAFHLVAYDVYGFASPEERMNLSSRKGSFCSQFENTEEGTGKHFTYVINLILPSDTNLAISLCYQPEDPNWTTSTEPWAVLFRKFIDADRDFQKKRFKLIPRIVDGSFMIRKTVPAKPALVANKGLMVPFNRAPHYFEVDVDISSDSTARVITKLCLGACKNIVVDIAFLVESQEVESLPEAIIGTVRMARVDLKKCKTVKTGDSLGYDK